MRQPQSQAQPTWLAAPNHKSLADLGLQLHLTLRIETALAAELESAEVVESFEAAHFVAPAPLELFCSELFASQLDTDYRESFFQSLAAFVWQQRQRRSYQFSVFRPLH